MDSIVDDGFRKVCQSLKLARRAELVDPDNNDSLIDSLYVDPLPGNRVLKSALDPHTTFFIGRKGCGKSTIFQKLQSEIQQKGTATSAYIDIKTVFESCQIDPAIAAKLVSQDDALPAAVIEKLLLQKAFLESLVAELRVQLRRKFSGSLWEKFKKLFGSHAELDSQLEELVRSLEIPSFDNIAALHRTKVKKDSSISDKGGGGATAQLSSSGGQLSMSGSYESAQSASNGEEYSQLFLRSLNIKGFITRLRDFLERSGYNRLYVLIDDFSELPPESMKFVVDVLLAPLTHKSVN